MDRSLRILLILLIIPLSIWIGKEISTGQWSFTVLLILTLGAAFVSFFSPKTGLAMMLVGTLILPSIQLGTVAQEGKYSMERAVKLRPEDFIIVVVFFGWWSQSLLKKAFGTEQRVPKMEFGGVMIALAMIMILSTLVGLGLGTTTLTRGLLFLFKRIEYFFIFFLTCRVIETHQDIRFYLKLFIVLSILVILFGFIEIFALGRIQAVSTFTEAGANALASFLLVFIPFIAALYINSKTTFSKLLTAVCFLISMAVFVYSRSRGGYVAFVFSAAVFFVITRQFKWIIPLAFVAVLSLAKLPEVIRDEFSSIQKVLPLAEKGGAMSRRVPLRFQKRFIYSQEGVEMMATRANIDPSWRARLIGISKGLPLFTKNPLLGGGLGSLELGFVDNQYALDLFSMGLLGLSFFLFMIYKIYLFVYRVYKESEKRDYWIYSAAVGMVCGLVGMMVHALTITNFYTIRTMVPFWFLLAVLQSGHWILSSSTKSDTNLS